MKHKRAIAALLATASVALLTGCAPSAPAALTTSGPPAATATPTPTPAPPTLTGPTVRVPTTCEELVPEAMVEQFTGRSMSPVAVTHSTFPTSYGNARVGTLECEWSDGGKPNVDEVVLIVTIAPDVTRDGFESFVNGEQGSGVTSPSSVGPDAYFTGPNGKPGGFMFLTDHYGASAFSFGASGGFAPPATAVQTLLEHVYGIVSALPTPLPLWKPTPDLRGATDCDGLATADQIAGTVGIPSPRVVKSDDGEYSTSLFNVDRQVGGYSCDWITDSSSSTASAQIAVLPGGAGYLPRVRTAGSRDISGIGDFAFVGPDGRLNVIAANGWVQVSAAGATDDQLVALARVVLENNGYTQG